MFVFDGRQENKLKKVLKNTCKSGDKMEKCQYILERDLPSMASAEELARVEKACNQRSLASLGRSAKESIAKWSVPEYALRGDIIRHIKSGKKVFHKFKDDGSGDLIENDVQANITLSAGFDVYVEIWLEDDDMIVIYAHDHTPGRLRLPQ